MIRKCQKAISILLVAVLTIQCVPDKIYATDLESESMDNIEIEKTYTIPEEWKGLEYAIFTSGDKGEAFYVNTAEIVGSVHTNGDFLFQGNRIALNGTLEAAGGITLRTSDGNDSQDIDEKVENAGIIDMPDIKGVIHERIFEESDEDNIWDLYEGNESFGSDELLFENNMYASGSLTFNATTFKGSGIMIAGKDINYNVGNISGDNKSYIFMSSEEGNININGSCIELNAVLYAPEGTVVINAGEVHIRGRIIAKEVVINGTLIDIQAGDNDYAMLDKIGVFNREVIKEYDSMDEFQALTDAKTADEEYIPAIMDDSVTADSNWYIEKSLDDKTENSAGIVMAGQTNSDISIDKSFSFAGMIAKETFTGTVIDSNSGAGLKGSLNIGIDQGAAHISTIVFNKGHAYAASDDELPWKDAEAVCEQMGGHLVVLDDVEENMYVNSLLISQGKDGYTAIGYTDEDDEGRWHWVNGSDSKFEFWQYGEPNDGLSLYNHQNYAYMYYYAKWDDGEGIYNNNYVCEWDNINDIAVISPQNVIVRLVLDKDVYIDGEEETAGDFDIYEMSSGERVIIWKVSVNSGEKLSLPIKSDNVVSGKNAVKDIAVFYREDDVIRSEKLDDIEISPENYGEKGTWSTVYDSHNKGAKWSYFDYEGTYPNDSDIHLYAYAADDLNEVLEKRYDSGIREISLEEACTEEGITGIEGRYLLIRAELSPSTDGLTPFLDRISVGANTKLRPEKAFKEHIELGNHIEDKDRNTEVTGSVEYVDIDTLISGMMSFPIFNMSLDRTSYVSGDDVVVMTDVDESYNITIKYDDLDKECNIENGKLTVEGVSAGEHTIEITAVNAGGNTFSRKVTFPVYEKAPDVRTWFDKDTYYEGDDVILNVEEGYRIIDVSLDGEETTVDSHKNNVLFTSPKAGLHTISLRLEKDDEQTDIKIYLFVNDAPVKLHDGGEIRGGNVIRDTLSDADVITYSDEMYEAMDKAEKNAVKWLMAQADENGTWENSGLMNRTCDALATLNRLGESIESTAYAAWLAEKDSFNTDELCHALWAGPDKDMLNVLWERQNSDGGFGLTAEYTSDPYDTLLVLITELVMQKAGLSVTESGKVERALSYIAARRNADGGFGYNTSDSSRVMLCSEYGIVLKGLGYRLEGEDILAAYCLDGYTGNFDNNSFEDQCMRARFLQMTGCAGWTEDEMNKLLSVQAEDGSIYGNIEDTIIYILMLDEAVKEEE